MGSVCCCFHVKDREDRVNSSNNNETCNCPNCFLMVLCSKFAAITFNKDQTPANQNNGTCDTPQKEHVNVESTGCLGFSSRKLQSDVAYGYESSEEEDVCPTCLEEYTPENPKIVTKCCHHYHLSCIYEWMERSSTCPVCSKEMIFDETS